MSIDACVLWVISAILMWAFAADIRRHTNASRYRWYRVLLILLSLNIVFSTTWFVCTVYKGHMEIISR